MHSPQFQAVSSTGWTNEAILALIAVLMMFLVPLGGWAWKHWAFTHRSIYNPFTSDH